MFVTLDDWRNVAEEDVETFARETLIGMLAHIDIPDGVMGAYLGDNNRRWRAVSALQKSIRRGDEVTAGKMIQEYGLFLCTSLSESFGIYYLELLSSGVVGVFLDRPWIRRLLPDYKYIVSREELAACMLHVYENYEEARGYVVNTVIPEIKEKYSLVAFCEGLRDNLLTEEESE